MKVIHSILLLGLAYLVSAEVPACQNAKCTHCEVEFIKRMCPKQCGPCFKNFRAKQRAAPTVQTQQQSVVNNVAQQQPVYQPLPIAFAAPQQQFQYPVDTSTLAPLIEQPRAEYLSPQLARQPADLAQPLPEYQNIPVGQQPITQTAPQQSQFFNQQPQQQFAQPSLFPEMNFPTIAPPTASQGSNNALLNPFQPFFQQTFQNGGLSALDPLGLFNFGGNNLAQAAPLTQATQPISNYQSQQLSPFQSPYQTQAQQTLPQQTQYASQQYNQQPQHQYNPPQNTNFRGSYQQGQAQVSSQTTQNQAQTQPQTQQAYRSQQPSFNIDLPRLPTMNLPQVPPSPPAPVNLHGQYQNANAQQTSQPQPIQRTQQPVQPQQQVQPSAQTQPAYQQNFAQVQTQAPVQTSQSIDRPPVNYQKYIDTGKGPVGVAPVAQQCPRQPGWSPCITKDQANDRFRNCCARLGEGCVPLCNYDATLATMQLAVLTGRCPLNKVADMMICASGYQDATPCCEAYNVFEPGYEHCRPYCNPAAGLPEGGLLSEKYKCLVKLGAIQQCFYVSQKP
ncbi:unnamed protein product [Auanema sp. JU1783]|nr:unnamed protein product [Auanema sp. JU1783]